MEVPEKVMFDLGQKGSLESFRFLLVVFLKIKYSTLSKLGLFPETRIIIPSVERCREQKKNPQTILDILFCFFYLKWYLTYSITNI